MKIFVRLFQPVMCVAKVCPPSECMLSSGGLGNAQISGNDSNKDHPCNNIRLSTATAGTIDRGSSGYSWREGDRSTD